MKAHNIFRKIGSILSEINEQYQYLSESPDKLNELELELLSANADFLAEHIKVLKRLDLSVIPAETEAAPAEVSQTPEYQESVKGPETFVNEDELIKPDLPEAYSNFKQPVESEVPAAQSIIQEHEEPQVEPEAPLYGESQAESVPDVSEDPVKESPFSAFFRPESNAINHPEPSEKASGAVHSPVIEEVIPQTPAASEVVESKEESDKVPSLNELISAQRSSSASFNKPLPPVSDLKSAINLNDKLLFIKDLFNGYSLAYSEAIEIINRFDSFEAADNFLKANYAVKNNWAERQKTADKFYELLNRRFAK